MNLLRGLPGGGHCRKSGVEFAIKNSFASPTVEFPFERITLSYKNDKRQVSYSFLIYEPTMSHSDETLREFYDDLTQLLRKLPIADKLVIFGDFNVIVGNDYISWLVSGRNEIGKCN